MKEENGVFISFIRSIFEAGGVEIKWDLIVARRSLAQEVVRTLRIYSVETFIRFFGEGQYIFEGYDVHVKGVDLEPFVINYICIEAEYTDSEWKLLIRTDEEEIFSPEPENLENRSNKIANTIQSGLNLLTSLLKLSDHVIRLKDLIGGQSS